MSYGNTSSESDRLISIPAEKPALAAPAESTSNEPVVEGKWSHASTLFFILVFCGLSWAVVIAAFLLAR